MKWTIPVFLFFSLFAISCTNSSPEEKTLAELEKLKIENDLCEQQCSDGCRSLFLGDGYCTLRYIIYNKKPHDFNVPAYQGCNVASCRYDNGDCPSS